jgi:hypothetical protein
MRIAEGGLVDLKTVPTSELGLVHRHIGVSQQYVTGVFAAGQGDADARRHRPRGARNVNRLAHCRQDPLARCRQLVVNVDVF